MTHATRRLSTASHSIEGSDNFAVGSPPKQGGRFAAVEQAAAAAAGRKISQEAARPDATPPATNGSESNRPEDLIEVLCHGVPVPLTMSLAATKQYMWQNPAYGGGGLDVVLEYRWKNVEE